MAFKLKTADHRQMDAFLDSILKAYKDGTLSLLQARASLAHLITAGVIDNEGEFKKFIELKPSDIYRDSDAPGS
ncbi:MAG: hypothetical protein JO004_00965 [Methylobacteriaceae bacterium]|nr:hypothetical protein [Methylobacteriaceae bacterium]